MISKNLQHRTSLTIDCVSGVNFQLRYVIEDGTVEETLLFVTALTVDVDLQDIISKIQGTAAVPVEQWSNQYTVLIEDGVLKRIVLKDVVCMNWLPVYDDLKYVRYFMMLPFSGEKVLTSWVNQEGFEPEYIGEQEEIG